MRISPCKDCQKRTLTCHYQGACEEWEAWKAEQLAEKEYTREKTRSIISASTERRYWRNMRYGRKNQSKIDMEHRK